MLAGQRIIDWSLQVCREVADGVVLVVLPEEAPAPDSSPEEAAGPWPAADVVTAGAPTRAGSVRAGLAEVPGDADVIVVHDAARPLADAALFRSVIDAVDSGAAGAVPGLPVTDTLKQVDAGRVVRTIERDGLVAVQTPQAFRATALRRAHEGSENATDDAALVEAAGEQVVVVPGSPRNLKLTTRADLQLAELFVAVEP